MDLAVLAISRTNLQVKMRSMGFYNSKYYYGLKYYGDKVSGQSIRLLQYSSDLS